MLMILFKMQGSITVEQFKLKNDFKEYIADSIVNAYLFDEYIRRYKEGSAHGYKIKYTKISGIYKDNQSKQLYFTFNLDDGNINTIIFAYNKDIDRFVCELNNKIALKHAEGIVV